MASKLNTVPDTSASNDDSWTSLAKGMPEAGAEVEIKLSTGEEVPAVWTGDFWRTECHSAGLVLGWRELATA